MSKSFELQDFITESESLLEDLDFLESTGDDTPADPEQQKQLRKKSFNFMEDGVELQLDGYFEIDVDSDDRRAIAGFFPPEGDREPITVESVMQRLASMGVNSGIDEEAIKEAVYKCNTERIPVEGIYVARATAPVSERSEHLEMLEELTGADSQETDESEQRTDYKKRSPFVMVKKNQLIARVVPKRPGVAGYTVKGAMIPYKREAVPSLRPGRNTEKTEDGLVATCDGRLSYDNRSVWVSPVLDIDGNVGYETGHVNFPGDVIVRGEVEHGFQIRAGGKLYCLKTLDVTEVECEGDLIVRQGVVGRGTGTIRAGGGVKTRFIENCNVEAVGDISVLTGIVNSRVSTLGRMETGPRGIIVGGRVSAQQGVISAQIGTASGPKTEVYCGTDFQIEQKLVLIRDRNIELAMKLKTVEERLKAAREGSPAAVDLANLRTRMKEAIHKLNESASQLVFQLDKSEDAQVLVVGRVYPGTYIEICHVPFVVDRTLQRVRVKLDKKTGKVITEPLRESPFAMEGD